MSDHPRRWTWILLLATVTGCASTEPADDAGADDAVTPAKAKGARPAQERDGAPGARGDGPAAAPGATAAEPGASADEGRVGELLLLIRDFLQPGEPASLQFVFGEGEDATESPYYDTTVQMYRADLHGVQVMLAPYRRAGRPHSFWIVWDAERQVPRLDLYVSDERSWRPVSPDVFTFECEYVDYVVDEEGDLILEFSGTANRRRGSAKLVPTRIFVHSFHGEGGKPLDW